MNNLFAALETKPSLREDLSHAIGSPVGGSRTRDEGALGKVSLKVVRNLFREFDLRKKAVNAVRGQVSPVQEASNDPVEGFTQVQEHQSMIEGMAPAALLKHPYHVRGEDHRISWKASDLKGRRNGAQSRDAAVSDKAMHGLASSRADKNAPVR